MNLNDLPKLPNLTNLTGGCRRTFIAFTAVVGMFIFGYLKSIDVTNTVASIAIALAATNGTQSVLNTKFGKEAKSKIAPK